MSSDSSFPRQPDRRPKSVASEPDERHDGAVVLDFPTDEVSSPGKPVPAGTWEDAPEDDPGSSAQRPLRRGRDLGQVVVFPRQPRTHKRRRAAEERPQVEAEPVREPPSSRPRPAVDRPERPKYLASELLKEDWAPRTPLRRTLRWGAIGAGATGAIAILVFGGIGAGSLLLAAWLAACATVGLAPWSAERRGVALAGLGVTGTAVAGWMRMVDGDEPAAPLLVSCVAISASALFFRAAHRTSRLARALVVVGLVATGTWLVLTDGVGALQVETLAWQSFAFPVLRVLLAMVVLGSALTLLDPTGHGGAWIAGGAFLGWLALDVAATVTIAAMPLRAGPAALDYGSSEWLATLAFPFLTALAAGGLCQVWVLASRAPWGRREVRSLLRRRAA